MGRASKGHASGAVALNIILVRPQLGENIGMAARAMLNCGLSSLRLVSPRDGWPNPKAERAASGADIVLDKAKVFDSVGEAVADLERVVATTARNRELSQRILTPRRAAAEMRGWIGQGERVGILFGPEWMAGDENVPAERMSEHSTRPAAKDELQNLFDHLERALDQSGFLRNKAMRPAMVHNLRAFLQRSAMTEQEVRSFHGVIKYLSKHKHSEE